MNKLSYSLAGLGIADKMGKGVVSLANEQNFNTSFFSEPLTQYAIGWESDQRKLETLLDFLAPQVTVGRRFEFKKADNSKAFLALSESEDIRAIGGEFKRIEYSGDIVQSKTFNKGLTTVIDLDEESAEPGLEERKVAWLRKILLRTEIRRAITLLATGATNADKTWTPGSGASDPDTDIADMLIAGGDSAGVEPNRLLMGVAAWQLRVKYHRAQNTAGGFASAGLSPEQLADLLALDEVMVCRERYQTASAKKNLAGEKTVIAFNADANLSKDDPSNIKRFVSSQEGGQFAVYRQELTSKLVALTVSHYSNIVLTSDLGLRKLSVV